MPKTIRNKYDEVVTFNKLLEAHKKARRGKREKKKVIQFELMLEDELLNLEKELRSGTYKHGKYHTFQIYEPKERTIMAYKRNSTINRRNVGFTTWKLYISDVCQYIFK